MGYVLNNKISWRVAIIVLLCGLIIFPHHQAQADDHIPDPRFGAVQAYMFPEAAAEMGLGWDRILIHWNQRQPDNAGQWTISEDERMWVAEAQTAGRAVVALLMGTPSWATDGLFGRGVPRGIYLPVDHPDNHWATFVRQVVGEYQGQITHWIIWNEPDIGSDHPGAQFDGSVEDYYRLLKVAYLVAKEVDSAAVIHLAALTHWHDVVYGRLPYLQRFLEVVVQDPSAPEYNYYFDVATLHIYFKTETVYDIIGMHRYLLTQAGLWQPIWLNETNAPPMDDPESPWSNPLLPVTLDEQASFVVQSVALAFAAGAQRVAVYKLRDASQLPPGHEPYGLFSFGGSARPAALAYEQAIRHLTGFRSVQHEAHPEYHLVRFNRDAGSASVVWARGSVPVELQLRSTAWEGNTVYDKYGQPQIITPDHLGIHTLTLPAANCPEGLGCIVGGAPYIIVETVRSSGSFTVIGPGRNVLSAETTQTGAANAPSTSTPVATPGKSRAVTRICNLSQTVQPMVNWRNCAR